MERSNNTDRWGGGGNRAGSPYRRRSHSHSRRIDRKIGSPTNKRKRSRSGERNGWVNKHDRNHARRTDHPLFLSPGKDKHYNHNNDRRHHNDRDRGDHRHIHHRSREQLNKKMDEKRSGSSSSSSVLSPPKSKSFTAGRRSGSRSRDIITGSSNHRHRSDSRIPAQHYHHQPHNNKPSALDNRDTKKRDHDDFQSNRSSSSPSKPTHQRRQQRDSRPSATDVTVSSKESKDKDRCTVMDNTISSGDKHKPTSTTNGVFNHKRSLGSKCNVQVKGSNKDCKDKPKSLTMISSPNKRRRSDGREGNTNHCKRLHPPISKRSKSLNSALPPIKCSTSTIAARRKQRALSSFTKAPNSTKQIKSRRSPVPAHCKKPRVPAENGLPNSSSSLPTTSSCTTVSVTVSSSTTKVTLDDLNGNNNTADEYDELIQVEKWVRSAPDELYYSRQVDGYTMATDRTQTLCEKFETGLLVKPKVAREEAEMLGEQKMAELAQSCGSNGRCDEDDSDSSSSNSDSSSSDEADKLSMTRSDSANRELERRKKHPRRLHEELWHNDPGLMNDGPVCRCSAKARRFGIRHGFYPGEERIPPCNQFSNNKNRLYHYRITISPPKNFLISTPTVINHDGHEYIFEGFSIFSHYKLDLSLPACKVIRFNIKYDVFVAEERFPESFCVKELLLFETYLFREILELVDLRYDWNEETGCSQFHLMPRFVRQLPDNGQEILSMSRVLIHLLKGDRELVKEEDLEKLYTVDQSEWQNFADRHKGTIVTKWGMKPCAIRVDQIDREVDVDEKDEGIPFPLIVHFGIRPPQLSYAGNAGYQRAWRRYVKYRHLLSNMPKPSPQDKLKLLQKELMLQAMRTASDMKRDVTVAIPSKGFRTTGICCDLVQHAMLIPVLMAHLRFHKCLETLESRMAYPFENRYLLQLAMTHPSYRENFGTNPDHARNALTNCGIRQPEYGDRRIHYASTRKRGINTLINIMAKFGSIKEKESGITHNERLEFLGDAVVEFTTSIHLFHIFPDLEEGGLATYRAAIVQNQHLAVLAQALNLDQYMLYAHGSDLCHDSELRHAMANCFEALMGALFLDGGIDAADRVFGTTLFGNDAVLLNLWANYPKHPLQQEEPTGDRNWIESHEVLQKLAEFESNIGIPFNHIRLLARAFTDRSLGYNNLTKGSNQRLEFLGDTVLQLISSEYLYRHFPDHHEGHLSLLRSSLVNNRTQSLVCEDLGMPQYAMRGDPKSEMKTKDKADLLEAFLGALYIDKGLTHCIVFCEVCFFPRLNQSITKQEWNDPKSKLQQCCLTLRAMDGREPDIPVYKVTESLGPTNTRTYIVAVYFRGERLATAQGHSIQEAEMNAAMVALDISGDLFPQLHHQKRIMEKTKKTH